jgi:hypothetical protein
MKNRKLIMGLVASAWFLGGCLVEPLDEEAGEDLATVTEAMSADRTGAPSGEDTDDPQDDSNSESASAIVRAAAGQVPLGSQQPSTTSADPNKPQPDPWDGTQQKTTSTTVNR